LAFSHLLFAIKLGVLAFAPNLFMALSLRIHRFLREVNKKEPLLYSMKKLAWTFLLKNAIILEKGLVFSELIRYNHP